MATVKIDIPDQQAVILGRKAAAKGLTLESWFQKVAEEEAGGTKAHSVQHEQGSIVEEMRQLRAGIKPDPEGWTTRDYVNYGRR